MPCRLPPRPNLEHLREQAKALLKGHGRKDAKVCGKLRSLHRFARASDQEILAAQLTPAEARHAVAKDYGFKCWNELKKRVQGAAPPIRNRPPLRLDALRTGSTVTPIIELGRAFAHRPRNVSINVTESDEKNRRDIVVEHNGRRAGYLYLVHVDEPATDLRPHPTSTMAPGEEMLTTRELKLHLLEELPAGDDLRQEFTEPLRRAPRTVHDSPRPLRGDER